MKISVNYLRKYLDFDLPAIEVLIDRIGSQLGALEEGATDLWEIYNQVIVAKVVNCQPIEGSDHLKLCKIDDGHKHTDDAIRDGDGLIQVVCGAPNVSEGQLVAWLPPKSVVPGTFFKEKLILESKDLHGNISHGMLASSRELGIDDDHDGILIIDLEANAGDSFAKLYELDDYILDIENKMFTHRPDCFGLIGIAREVAGILNQPFRSPEWYLNQPDFKPDNNDLPIKVENEIPSLVPRYSAISLDKLKVKSSPILTKSYLSRMGIRPINSIVDATNLTMLETGQPLHAYDYHKLKQLSGGEPTLSIRNPKSDEKVNLINEKTVQPPANSIVIACNEPVGMGGIMGGSNSEISEETSSIVLESASFDMYSIRRSSMELGVFSDAVTRFTKGQSPLQITRVLVRAIELIKQLCGEDVTIASDLADNNNLPEATIKRDSLNPPIQADISFIDDRLGTTLTAEEMSGLLGNVECQTEASSSEITLYSPFWRTDLEIREDIVEEVGRLHGYDHIEMKQLTKSIKPIRTNPDLEVKARIRNVLATAGANETLNYSFISKKLLSDVNQDETKAYHLANSLSPDVEFYRLSITPSLLNKVNSNLRAGYNKFALFEIGNSYLATEHEPTENKTLSLVFASNESINEAAYYQARAYLEFLSEQMHLEELMFTPLKDQLDSLQLNLKQSAMPFDINRSALITTKDHQAVGVIGEFSSESARKLKLPANCAGFEIAMSVFSTSRAVMRYHKLSRFPAIKQDMTLQVPSSIPFVEVSDFITSELSKSIGEDGYIFSELLSIFKPKDKDGLNYAFRITITDYNKTLKDVEVNQLLDDVATKASEKLKAIRI